MTKFSCMKISLKKWCGISYNSSFSELTDHPLKYCSEVRFVDPLPGPPLAITGNWASSRNNPKCQKNNKSQPKFTLFSQTLWQQSLKLVRFQVLLLHIFRKSFRFFVDEEEESSSSSSSSPISFVGFNFVHFLFFFIFVPSCSAYLLMLYIFYFICLWLSSSQSDSNLWLSSVTHFFFFL